MVMRGGTSKGFYFLQDDLPPDDALRDDLLLRLMGSPDPRQIDGIGGAHPLTSKVAVVGVSPDDADVDYLFLQVGVDSRMVSDRQNCGNLLAGVGPFAIERALVHPDGDTAKVRIRMLNTGSIATATFHLEDGLPTYAGDTEISGVPGAAARIDLDFEGLAGGSCGALLPTGNPTDGFAGVEVTCVDNGMPVVVARAADLGVSGYESCAELEEDQRLRDLLEAIRVPAGAAMRLGDVRETSVPKLTLVAPPANGGSVSTRTFIPHRCHDAIGVLGAVSVATACLLPDSVADGVLGPRPDPDLVSLEHPTGTFEARVEMETGEDGQAVVHRAGIIRTARKLMDGVAFPRPR